MKKSVKILAALLLSGLVLGFAGCKTESDDDSTDKTSPVDVTELSVACVNGTDGKVNAVLSWKDPGDSDLFGLEVNYAEKTSDRAAVSSMTKGSVFVAPGNGGTVINGLTAGTTYTFTVKAMDTSGNKSDGATKDAAMSLTQLSELKITLTPSTTEITNKDVTVSVSVTSSGAVSKICYVSGIKTSVDEVLKGTDITSSATFTATTNGDYTVAVMDYDGRRELSYIKIDNIDKTAPAAPTNLAASYDSENKTITLTWNTSDSDVSYYLVSYTKAGTAVKTDEKVSEKTYKVTGVEIGETEEVYAFTVKAVDEAGNEGSSSSKSINPKGQPSIDEFVIPDAGTKKEGSTVTATVTGKNFKATGVTIDNFSLTCDTSSITANSTITIVSDTELTVTLTIPGTNGSYNVTITSGTSSKTGTFTVKDTKDYAVGDIILTDGSKVNVAEVGSYSIGTDNKPVAVVAGFNANGVVLGLGLQSKGSLSWASSGTIGYKTSLTDIIGTTTSGDMDGSDNWEYICSVDPEGTASAATNYPAFNFAETHGTSQSYTGDLAAGWYIPSVAELYEVYKNKSTLQTSLTKAGGYIFDDYYWSSSQHDKYNDNVYVLNFGNGNVFNNSKNKYYSVLVLRAF